ncbi:ABC transporter permease subunit [Pedobacter petrophilus]|uniref:ABC transporter permease subunit n=1 Tax=Pedobacter petrophilus TaxID=1908241 RepID=A0A7K0G1D3_9SPHI|nr:ABC transporter permease subunit [Pedobacter petrophilus]MRX77648.1 ABC transporter permease subunit [Pedobacter petrophilus]
MKKNEFATWQMLIKKELLVVYRNKTMLISTVMIWTLFIAATICTFLDYQSAHKQRTEANMLFRQQWEHQQRNPHDAAHFGTYLFKTINLLNVFDTGLDDYAGNTYRIEAHVQHEPAAANAIGNDGSMRFGRLTLALIMQLLIPLLILFITSTSITSEKENGTLKMLLAQGLSTSRLIWAKAISSYLFIVAVVLPIFLLMFSMLFISPDFTILLSRLLWIILAFLLYFLFVALLGTLISAWSSNSGKALLTALSCWILMSIISPKLLTGIADRSYSSMSRAAFTDLVEQGYRKGLNGHDPYAERGDRFVRNILKNFHADSISELPFNIEGLTLQYHEHYRSLVFNHYLAQVERQFDKQQNFLTIAGIFNPFLSIKRFSMALSGTDYYHQQYFFKQAQTYRNHLIRKLNMQLAWHSKSVEGEYTVGPQYFAQIKNFDNRLPPIIKVIQLNKIALYAIAGWILLLATLLHFIASRSLARHYEPA